MAQLLAEHEPTPDDAWYGVDVEVGAINCEVNADLCNNEFNVRRFPTVRLVSPGIGMQHEIDDGNRLKAAEIKDAVLDIASEWLWLFSRASVEEIEGPGDFEPMVLESESFGIVVFLDGETCGPCRTAKTNALRLSAGLKHSGADVTVSYFNCAKDTSSRKFCTATVGVPPAPHSPQVRGYTAGSREEKDAAGGAGGEVLYNANEIAPHAALRMIESIVRLSTKVEEAGSAVDGGEEGGKRGGFDEGVSEDEPERPGGGDGEGGRRRPENNYNKLNWNGPSARKSQIASGGGGMPARPMLGGR